MMEIKAPNLKEGYDLLSVSKIVKPLPGDIILIRAFGMNEQNKDVEIWEVKPIQYYLYAVNPYHSSAHTMFMVYFHDDETPVYAPFDNYYPTKEQHCSYIATNYRIYKEHAELIGDEVKDFKTFIKDVSELNHVCPTYWTDEK